MPPESPPLPPKPEVALALLQTAASVYVHLDPRSEEVVVPPWFKNQPQLVLQIGLNMAVPIPDLDVGKEAVSCTLSFNRSPEFCRIPWESIYGLVGEDGRGMIWPESIPPEVAAAADGRATAAPKAVKARAHLRVASATSSGKNQPEKAQSLKKKGFETAASRKSSPARDAKPSSRASSQGEKALSRESLQRQAERTLQSSKTGSAAATRGGPSRGDSGRRRELPPYLRVVK